MANYFSLLLLLTMAICLFNNELGTTAGNPSERFMLIPMKLKVTNLTYENCGEPSDPFRIDKLEIDYDSNVDIVVNLSVTFNADLHPPIKATVDVWFLRIKPWPVKMPCIGETIGSCTFPDVCQIKWHMCPAGAASKCPVHKGAYSVSNIKIPNPEIAEITLPDRFYKYKVLLEQEPGRRVACYTGNFTLDVVQME